jgi:proteasome alpha subunit
VIGGKSEALQALLKEKGFTQPPELQAALALCIASLDHIGNQKLLLESLEVAVLDRNRDGRRFRRLSPADTKQLLSS